VGTACEVNECGGSEVKAQLWEDLIIRPLEPTAKTKNKTKTKTKTKTLMKAKETKKVSRGLISASTAFPLPEGGVQVVPF